MSMSNSKIDGENDLPVESDSLQGDTNTTNTNATGVGGTTTASETFDRVGTAASEFNDPGAGSRAVENRTGSVLNRDIDLDDDLINDDSPLRWIIPLVLLGLLVALGSWFCGKSEPVATISNANTANIAVSVNSNVTANINSNANITTANANQ